MTENTIKHVAIIMDGNGRWATGRAHSRVWGHIRGARVVSNIVEEAVDNGVESLTLYTFSTENWARPIGEVKVLFSLLKKFLLRERERILRHKISFKIIGDISYLPEETKRIVLGIEEETKDLPGMKLSFAFGYGGREEIVKAVNRFIEKNPGREITEDELKATLFRPEVPEIDLLIRTGGDQRISNFLLWQIAYAELYFTKTKWPEFTAKEFNNILQTVSTRERRFGAISKQDDLQATEMMIKENKSILEKTRYS